LLDISKSGRKSNSINFSGGERIKKTRQFVAQGAKRVLSENGGGKENDVIMVRKKRV